MNFIGAFSAGTNYSIGNAVSESGNSYIAIAANVNIDPAADVGSGTIGTYWALMAKKGDTGPIGTTGATGATGAIGRRGHRDSRGRKGRKAQSEIPEQRARRASFNRLESAR